MTPRSHIFEEFRRFQALPVFAGHDWSRTLLLIDPVCDDAGEGWYCAQTGTIAIRLRGRSGASVAHTLLHEMAHAAVDARSHGPVFRVALAVAVGQAFGVLVDAAPPMREFDFSVQAALDATLRTPASCHPPAGSRRSPELLEHS